MKSWFAFCVACLFVVGVVGCEPKAPTTTPAPAPVTTPTPSEEPAAPDVPATPPAAPAANAIEQPSASLETPAATSTDETFDFASFGSQSANKN